MSNGRKRTRKFKIPFRSRERISKNTHLEFFSTLGQTETKKHVKNSKNSRRIFRPIRHFFFEALTHHPFSHAANDFDDTFFFKKIFVFLPLVATTSTDALVRRCPLKRLRQQPSTSLLLLRNLASGAVGKFSPLLPRSNGERSEGW